MSDDIDPAAMEAAVEAYCRSNFDSAWPLMDEDTREQLRALVRQNLQAALPHILAAATCPCQTVAAELDWTQVQDSVCGVEDE